MFSKTCQYALRGVIFIATNSSNGDAIGSKAVAESLAVPQQFLAKILQQLVRHNILSSIKGPHGGFYLTGQNLETDLLTVVRCIDGDSVLNTCLLGLPTCNSDHPCHLHEDYEQPRTKLKLMLKSTRIKDYLH
jgi:Rrf2 family transcriptional regulator, iron-sulfur cluster assembly transcription factor